MNLNKVKVCQQADNKIKALAGWTGLRPNIVCRMGLCLSLEDPRIPDPSDYPENSDREFNRYTLTGEWDDLFVTMLRQRKHDDDTEHQEEALEEKFRAHLNRGVIKLAKRVKSIEDLGHLFENKQEDVKQLRE